MKLKGREGVLGGLERKVGKAKRFAGITRYDKVRLQMCFEVSDDMIV